MSLPVTASDPTLADAMAALEKAESTLDQPEAAPAEPKPDSATPPPTAPAEPQPGKEATPPEPQPETPGTPSTTEKVKEPDKQQDTYAKSAERKARTWKEINAEKEATRAEAAKVKLEREAFDREKLAWEKKRSESAKANVKPPEFYEQGAANLEAKAKQAEDNADFDLAAELRVRAKDARALAKELRERKPDPTEAEQAKAFDSEQEKWTKKAAIDYPDLAKKDSGSMAKLKAMITPGSDSYDPIVHEAVRTSPAGMYYASMLAHNMTVAARVPTLEKELADSRAEVKKLNGKLSVNGSGLVNGQPQAPDFRSLSLEQQEAQLRAEAASQRFSR